MKKIISLILITFLFISCFSNTFACSLEDGWTGCSGSDISTNWGDVPHTADYFSSMDNPDPLKFDDLPPSEQTKYFSDPANIDKCPGCADKFYSSELNVGKNKDTDKKYFGSPDNIGKNEKSEDKYFTGSDLGDHVESSNKYLQRKFGNEDVTFNVVKGMMFKDDPPTLSAEGVDLILREGTEKGTIPVGATTVDYDVEQKHFVFDPRKITVDGENMVLEKDGSIRFESEGSITDEKTGAKVSISKGDKIKLTEEGLIVNGVAVGEWKDTLGNTNKFLNFNGRLVLQPAVISSDDSQVTYQGKEINGRFVASIQSGRLRHISLQDSGSSYKDDFGKVAGQSSIGFDEQGRWEQLMTAGECRAEFGKKYISGEFEAYFKGSAVEKVKLISQDGYYKDHQSGLKVYHNSDAATIYFKDFSKSDISSLKGNLRSGESFALINDKGSMYGGGKVGIATDGFDYSGNQKSASFTRFMTEKGEQIQIDSEEEGDVARFERKADIGKVLQGSLFRKESASIVSNIKNTEGKLSVVLDESSLQTLASIREDPQRFIVSDLTTIINVGDGDAYMGISDGFGIVYEEDGKQMQIMGHESVYSVIGRKLVDVNVEIDKLRLEQQAAKLAGDDTKAGNLLKKKDSLEFLVHQDDIQGSVSTGNFDAALQKTEQFMQEHPDSPITGKIKFQIGELYTAKAANIDIQRSSEGILTLGGESYPLQYKTRFDPNTGKEEVLAWSPDGKNWMSLDETVVKGGQWDGASPRKENIELINSLKKSGGNIGILNRAADERKASLTGIHSMPSESYDEMMKSYQQAISLYQEAKDDPELSIEASLALGGVYMQTGKVSEAYDEYEILSKNSDPDISSQGNLGQAMAQAQQGNIEASLQKVGKALSLDPENQVAKAVQLQLQSGILKAVDSALSRESDLTLDMFEKKLGLEDYEGGVFDYMGQVIGNTGRIITDPVTGYSDNLLIVQEGVQTEISSQQAGLMVLKMANSKGITIQDIKEMTDPERKDMISEIIKNEDLERISFFNAGVGTALTNPDIRLVSQDGSLTSDQYKKYSEAMSRGGISWTGLSYEEDPELQELMSGSFRFKTGEGYVNKEGLEYTWSDTVFEGVDIKNLALIALPMAKVGQGVTWSAGLARGAQALKVAEAQTVAGALMSSLVKGGESIIGAEKAASLAESASALRNTISSSKVGQFLATEYGSGGIVDKSIGFIGRLGAEEAGEEALGWGVGNVVGVINPGWKESAQIISSTIAGHGNLFDGALEGLESSAKVAGSTTVKRVLFDEGGEVLGETVGVFSSKQARETFIDNLRKSSGEVIEDLGEGVFKLEGKTYYAALEGAELPTIQGIKAAGAADINLIAVEDSISLKFEEAKSLMKSEEPDFFSTVYKTEQPVEERGFSSLEKQFVEGKVDEIITASKKEFGHLEKSIEQNHFDEIATNTKTYVKGSEDAVDSLIDSAKTGDEVTIAYFESSKLTHANSLEGGHQVGNELVKDTNEVIQDHIKTLDPDAVVFRGPNGVVIVQSKALSKTDIADELETLEKKITDALPDDYPDRGVTGDLRLGTTTIKPTEDIGREEAKALYYKGLQESGAAAEYSKIVPGSKDFQTITSVKTSKEVDDFLYENHNFIPPEAEEGTLFVVKDQIDKVTQLRKEVQDLESLADSGDVSAAGRLETMVSERDQEATKLIAMFKRPSRFEANVEAVFEEKEIPILNFKAAENLQERFVKENIPFYRADGDLDHLRDVFKQYKVTGADDHYAAFYTETAAALKKYESDNPGVMVFLEKQSSSDEFALVIAGANKQQAEEVLEVTRTTMESVGKRQPFEKYHKVTGELIDPNGGTTTTIGSTLEEIVSSDQIEALKKANDDIVNLRKYISGKNTVGGYDTISSQQAESIMQTFDSYKNTGKLDALKEARESLTKYAPVLEQKGISSERVSSLLNKIEEGIAEQTSVAVAASP